MTISYENHLFNRGNLHFMATIKTHELQNHHIKSPKCNILGATLTLISTSVQLVIQILHIFLVAIRFILACWDVCFWLCHVWFFQELYCKEFDNCNMETMELCVIV